MEKTKDNIINYATEGAEQYLKERKFQRVFVPHIVSITGACENINTLFEIPYWGKKAFTAQTGQLYLELKTQLHEKVWCWMQSMRAEKESDGRHLTEFPLLEIEFKGDLEGLIDHIYNIVISAIKNVIKNVPHGSLYKLNIDPEKILFKKQIITYNDAIALLNRNGFNKFRNGDDLKKEHEAKITELLGPVFVTHYPKKIKFFNMKENAYDTNIVNSADLLLPFAGESVGAAERETFYDKLKERLEQSPMYAQLTSAGVKPEDFEWYLKAHQNKIVEPHSGAGIGWARVLQFIMQQNDIRNAIQYPTDSRKIW